MYDYPAVLVIVMLSDLVTMKLLRLWFLLAFVIHVYWSTGQFRVIRKDENSIAGQSCQSGIVKNQFSTQNCKMAKKKMWYQEKKPKGVQ